MDTVIDLRVLSAFTLLWLVIVPTPGANTLMITHVALSHSVRQVLVALAGNLVGIAIWALSALFGLVVLLAALPAASVAIHILGGTYLCWLGVRLLRSRGSVTPQEDGAKPALDDCAAFALGIGTALSNAQAVFFITSVFAVAGVVTANFATGLAAVGVLLACNAAYLAALGWLLQRPVARAFYGRYRRWLERMFGALFVIFGGRLLVGALAPHA